jgi:neutral ceramidase
MTLRLQARTVALLLGVAACAQGKMPKSQSDLGAVQRLPESQLGVAEVDITPPPGLGLFGHGPESRVAEGTLLRLRCHAFVFVGPSAASGSSEALAFIPCELPAPSLLLQRKVAQLVNKQIPLGAERIWISATHTHAGPGHYFASQNYSGPLSSRRIGFDEDVLSFLATRIAKAITQAYMDRAPGRWGWATRRVQGLSKNRSYAIMLRNPQRPAQLEQQLGEPGLDPALNAVDQQLSLLRLETRDKDGGWQALAALLVFGLHPTVIDHRNTLYNGDAFGYATRALAARLREQHGRTVLVGMANGIEGDVTSVRSEATPAEAERIGAQIAQHAWEAWNGDDTGQAIALDANAPVRSRYRELNLPHAYTKHGCLCKTPEVGTPVGGGADDHPTFWRALDAFNPGARRRPEKEQDEDCQNPKYFIQGLGDSVPGITFPEYAPIGVAQLGNGLLVTLPAELTTVVGMRIRESVQAVAAQHAGAPPIVAVVGLSHDYLQYVASAAEYPAQHYEGASTLYGRHTGELLRAQATCLTADLWGAAHADCGHDPKSGCAKQRTPIDQIDEHPYNAGPFRAHWLDDVPDETRGEFALRAPTSACTPDGALALEAELGGLAPSDTLDPGSFRVQVRDGSEVLDDEQGSHLRVRWDDDRRLWTLSWTPDVEANPALCQRPVRFRVHALARTIDSTAAQPSCSACQRGSAP